MLVFAVEELDPENDAAVLNSILQLGCVPWNEPVAEGGLQRRRPGAHPLEQVLCEPAGTADGLNAFGKWQFLDCSRAQNCDRRCIGEHTPKAEATEHFGPQAIQVEVLQGI